MRQAWIDHPEWMERMRTRRTLKRASLPFRMETVRAFGLTLEQAMDMYNAQGGVCAICGVDPKLTKRRLVLDHDHSTGKPRQFLCCACNMDLAVLENKKRLARLQAYLEKHENHKQCVA
jgi:hypothetical protein